MANMKDQNGPAHRHREKKPRKSRRAVRGKVQVPGTETGNSGTKGHRPRSRDQRSTRHDTADVRKTQRPDTDLGHKHHSHAGRSDSLADHDLRGKITEAQATRMLERLAREQLVDNNNAIFRVDQDIRAFGRYLIHRTRDRYEIFRSATLAAATGSIRVAISWCIADKLNRNSLTQDLLWADQAVHRRSIEIQHYRHTLDVTTDPDKRDSVTHRMENAKILLRYAQERLDKCLNLAKYWQQKGFNDETARTGIKN